MAYRTPQTYLQLLTLLLFTNRLFAVGTDVHFQYSQYSELDDEARESNPARHIMRGRSLGHPSPDLEPIILLSYDQSPTTRLRFGPQPFWIKQSVGRHRQPPIDPEKIAAFWNPIKGLPPHFSIRAGRVSLQSIPSKESPPLVVFQRIELPRYSQRLSEPDPPQYNPDDNYIPEALWPEPY